MDEYFSLYRGGSGEIEEKKSRFIATLEPATTEEEAQAFFDRIKKQYWDAKHNCTAFVIGDQGQIMRSSDDGEPSGTAGRPMLEVLTGEKITNVAVVVTRYFGGTLLGTGGLIRAYQGAVKEGLKDCVILKKIKGIELKVITDYTDSGKLSYMAASNNWNVMSTEYGQQVTTLILAELAATDRIITQITDATSARARVEKGREVVFARVGDGIEVFE